MADLGVEEYTLSERLGCGRLPVTVRWGFQPVHFNLLGYPTAVSDPAELFYFMDGMAFRDFPGAFHAWLGAGFTRDEFKTFQSLGMNVRDFSMAKFGRPSMAKGALTSAISTYRYFKHIFGDARPRILELGPGAGLLGALLIRDGFPYAATDVTQPFYLLQNRLWNWVSDNNLVELAAFGERDVVAPEAGKPVHIPWWKFASLRPGCDLEFDVVTCHTVLGEMHNWSMRFAIAMASYFLRQPGALKLFMFDSIGATMVGTHDLVNAAFQKWGFEQLSGGPEMQVYAPLWQVKELGSKESFRNRLQQQVAEHERQRCVGLEEVRAFLKQQLGENDGPNPDQEFFELIGGNANENPAILDFAQQLMQRHRFQ